MQPEEMNTVAESITRICAGRAESVSHNGRIADLVSAIRSSDLSTALIEIGWCSLNFGSPGMIRNEDVPRNPALMTHIFDYAVSVSPRVVVDDSVMEMDRVLAHAAFLKERAGQPEIPENLVKIICMQAQMEMNRRKIEQSAEPEGREAE